MISVPAPPEGLPRQDMTVACTVLHNIASLRKERAPRVALDIDWDKHMYVTFSCVHAFCLPLVAHNVWLSSQILVPLHWINNYIVYWTFMKRVGDQNVLLLSSLVSLELLRKKR